MSRRQNLGYPLLAIILDFFSLLGALAFAELLRNALQLGKTLGGHVAFPLPITLIAIFIWLFIFFLLAVYDPQNTFSLLSEFQKLVLAGFFFLLVLAGVLYFSYRDVSRLMVIYFFSIYMGLLLSWRLVYRVASVMRHTTPLQPNRVLVIGSGGLLKNVTETLHGYSGVGFEVVGFLSDEDYHAVAGKPVLGTLAQAKSVIQHYEIDEVVAAMPGHQYKLLQQLVEDLQELPIRIHVVPDYFHLALYHATVEDFGGLPLIHLRDPALTPYQRLIKRLFDIVVSSILLLFTLPLMAVIAVAIKLGSRGAVIFKQIRVGENGRLFTMYKFRSMIGDDENLIYDGAGNPIHKVPDDPRITRLGSFLRRTSLDELPQLFNVLKGEMSIVGPRPEMPWFVDKYEPWQRKRFAVPQGMTGWWQVNGRSNNPMHLHTEDDLYYIQNYSILLDLQIIYKTVSAVLRREGAY